MNTIDYGIIAKAQQLYTELGYQLIEVPWRVSVGILEVTKPAHVKTDYVIEGTKKALIASGEQGFMYLMNKGILPPGKYQTVTPCFRNESYDITHSKQFMKLELIEVLPDGIKDHKLRVEQFVQHAKSVMKMLGCNATLHVTKQPDEDPLLVPDTNQLDITVFTGEDNVELGSYGARSAHFGDWIYGTGVAEPRFSKTIRIFN